MSSEAPSLYDDLVSLGIELRKPLSEAPSDNCQKETELFLLGRRVSDIARKSKEQREAGCRAYSSGRASVDEPQIVDPIKGSIYEACLGPLIVEVAHDLNKIVEKTTTPRELLFLDSLLERLYAYKERIEKQAVDVRSSYSRGERNTWWERNPNNR